MNEFKLSTARLASIEYALHSAISMAIDAQITMLQDAPTEDCFTVGDRLGYDLAECYRDIELAEMSLCKARNFLATLK